MTHEVETKVLDIDAEAVVRRFEDLGAAKTQDTRLTVDWFRRVGDKPGEEPWFLRIRSNREGKHEVTWKARSSITGGVRRHKEINFPIGNPAELADLFQEFGFERYAHQEKDRTSYRYRDWRFDLDRYPDMPPFLEIEGESEEHVREGMELLGLGGKPTWANGERTLIEHKYGLDWYEMRF